MAAIVRHPSRVAATVSRAVRRSVLIGVIALCFSSAAQAAVLAHPGRAGHLRTADLPAGLQAYPRTLVELDRVRGGAGRARAAPRRRPADRARARALAAAELDRAAPAAGPPGAAGSSARSTPDMPIGPDPRGASGFLGHVHRPALADRVVDRRTSASPTGSRPGPGVPVTMIDSGVDLSHEEFAGRPDTIPLNTQTTDRQRRGAARHRDRLGRRRARQRQGDRRHLPAGQAPALGREPGRPADRRRRDRRPRRRAAKRGPGVINLSLGGFDRLPIEEHAILNAFGAGQLDRRLGRERPRGGQLARRTPRASRTCSRSAPRTRPTA